MKSHLFILMFSVFYIWVIFLLIIYVFIGILWVILVSLSFSLRFAFLSVCVFFHMFV